MASRTPIFRIYRTEEHCTPLQGITVHFKLSTGIIFTSRQNEPTSTHPNFTNFLFSPCTPLLPIASQQLHIGHTLITLLTNTVLHDPREQMRRRFHPLLQFHPAGKIKIHSASKISLASPATHTPSSTKIWLPVVPYVPEPTNPPFPPPINLRSNDPENLATLFKSPFFYHHPLVRISSSEEAGVTTTSIYPCGTRRDGYSTSKHRPV